MNYDRDVAASQYQNVFFYFRGPTSKSIPGAAEVQLEDNTTKALINLLQYSEGLTDSLLEALGVAGQGGTDWEYYLQRGPGKGHDADSRQLLILTPAPPPDGMSIEQVDGEEEGTGRVDAALHRPGGCLIAIECKVAAALDSSQLVRHAMNWKVQLPAQGKPPSEWHFRTWTDVFRWTRGELVQDHDPVTRFLLEQFSDYLALVGLAPDFAGFRIEDFQYLRQRQAQHDRPRPDKLHERLIKGRLEKLWLAVRDALGPDASLLGAAPPRAGALRGSEIWALASTDNEKRDVKPSLELTPDALELNITGGTKEQAMRFERMVSDPAGRDLLRGLSGYEIVAMRQTGQPTGKGTLFRGAKWKELDRCGPSELATNPEEQIEAWRQRMKDHERLAFHLRRSFAAEEVLAKKEGIAADLSATVRDLLPLLRIANGNNAITPA